MKSAAINDMNVEKKVVFLSRRYPKSHKNLKLLQLYVKKVKSGEGKTVNKRAV